MDTIIHQAAQPELNLRTSAGNEVVLPGIFLMRQSVTIESWMMAHMTPNNTVGHLDFVNGTGTGWSTYTMEKKSAGNPITGGRYFLLTGRKKPGATTLLKDNEIKVSIGANELARIYVSAAVQKVGWATWALPGEQVDPRVILDGAATTGDLDFAMTGGNDPALQLQLLIAGDGP